MSNLLSYQTRIGDVLPFPLAWHDKPVARTIWHALQSQIDLRQDSIVPFRSLLLVRVEDIP